MLTNNNLLSNRIKEGNVVAFNTLFRSYYRDLCAYSNSFLYDIDLARDVVQEVFINLWEKRESLPHFDNFEAYIFRSVKNKSLDQIRKIKSQNSFHAEILSNSKDFDNSGNESEIKELEGIIGDQIASLDEVQQKILQLKDQEIKHKEISEILSLSIRTVEWHVYEIRKKIKKSIKNYFSHQ
jgi:RNA polymerase sigma-70 factor (ECF subfamily)